MNDENEISKLKDLYDELWRDAKNLVQDMAGSINMYRNASYLLFALNLYPIYLILLGVFVISSLFAIIVLTFFGIKLLRVHLKLKDRYAKLLKMKSELED